MSRPQIPGDVSPQDFDHGLWQSPEAPSHLHKVVSPEDQGNPQLQLKLDPLCGNQGGYIYGIIYYCVPLFLSNPMVMFSGPNYLITTPVLKSITHFEGRLLSHSVLQSLAATRRLFEDPNYLALHELVYTFFQDSSKGNFKRLSSIQSAVKASTTSVFLGQLNWSIQVVFKQAVWHWPFWDNSYSTVGIPSHSSIFKMARSVLTQKHQYSWGSTLQDQSFNFSHIVTTFSSLGTFSPVN
ncbi:hypothetical protein O181_109076 [Austropuccinia psidii MF-1]|uniref:Uncharacterized protein n=1 Tax=Austropuccinia psidii MF-1 TaxID=1389203 RepID=A0A9Q3PQK2_9BASI|nr:hypothetical protein [Austropuccinia psidii MF-1]